MTIQNPVLTGFHPDPSICRVGHTFYIATSTFEWFPGVMIYESTDLQDWTLVSTPLDRKSQLDMSGNPASGGIWAPCLSYADNQFWLIYTDVKNWAGSPPEYSNGFKDTHNYLVTAPSITGPWSEPIYMNSSGFDPSLFHDDDGRKWFVNMVWDYRPWNNSFAGIVLQEYSHTEKALIGPRSNIFKGTSLALTEAPHLYKRNGWYYLMTAEGGTSYAHGVTLARSRTLQGPYEVHPVNPLVTSVKDISGLHSALNGRSLKPGDLEPYVYRGLQKAGHGSMASISDSEWVLAHLCGRPLKGTYRCPLGRETALQRLEWRDDEWPWPNQQGPETMVNFFDIGPGGNSEQRPVESSPTGPYSWKEDFNGPLWTKDLQTLRVPADERFSLSKRPGWLTLAGAESPSSTFRQSLLARRVQGFTWSAQTLLSFEPEDFQQFAGLVVRYDERSQYLLRVSGIGEQGAVPKLTNSNSPEPRATLGIMAYDAGKLIMPLEKNEVPVDSREIWLGVDMAGWQIQFRYSQNGRDWIALGPKLDASVLSDEYAFPMGFTGMFVGIGCFDVSVRSLEAHFDYLEYSHE